MTVGSYIKEMELQIRARDLVISRAIAALEYGLAKADQVGNDKAFVDLYGLVTETVEILKETE